MNDTINDVVFDTAAEPAFVDLNNFADMAEEPGGAWPKAWYRAEIIEGYSTSRGTVFTTSDATSKDGTSRNLRLCFKVKRGGDSRNIQASFNYRATDFTPARMAHVKEARKEFAGVQGKWADGDAQRSSLAIAKITGLGKAVGGGPKLTDTGTIIPGQFVSKEVDVYLVIGDNGYNEVKNVLKAGERVSG